MFKIEVHKSAQKALAKAPVHIQRKATKLVGHLIQHGTKDAPCKIKPMHGKFQRQRYHEAILDKDFRIIFRREENMFYIRHAGTHNALGTG